MPLTEGQLKVLRRIRDCNASGRDIGFVNAADLEQCADEFLIQRDGTNCYALTAAGEAALRENRD